jgi:hypothetical protein
VGTVDRDSAEAIVGVASVPIGDEDRADRGDEDRADRGDGDRADRGDGDRADRGDGDRTQQKRKTGKTKTKDKKSKGKGKKDKDKAKDKGKKGKKKKDKSVEAAKALSDITEAACRKAATGVEEENKEAPRTARELLICFYEEHDPAKMENGNIDVILERFNSIQELGALTEALMAKYSCAPDFHKCVALGKVSSRGAASDAASDVAAAAAALKSSILSWGWSTASTSSASMQRSQPQGNTGCASSSAAKRSMLQEFYERHEPSRAHLVEKLLEIHSQQELREILYTKYGEDPFAQADGSEVGSDVPSPMHRRTDYVRTVLQRFYEEHEPSRYKMVDTILSQFEVI